MNGWRELIRALTLLALSGVGQADGQSLALSSASVIFPTAGMAQLNARGVQDSGTILSIDPGGSSAVWMLYLRAGSATLTPGGKPVSDLLWRLDGSATWTPVGTTDRLIASGIGPATVRVYLRTILCWAADGPGEYATDVTYSLTTS